MKKGGLDLNLRGPAFEDHVRNELLSDLKRSPVLNQSIVISRSISLKEADGDGSEEIDLLWRFGNTLVVGELKCSVFPSGPLEWYNLLELVEGAAIQAKRKAEFVGNNLDSLSSQVPEFKDLETDSMQVLPLVVLNRALGAGVPVNGVPVVDQVILENYISGSMDFGVVVSEQGTVSKKKTKVFFQDILGAEQGFLSFVTNYPPVAFARTSMALEWGKLLLLSPADRPAAFAILFVDIDPEKILESI